MVHIATMLNDSRRADATSSPEPDERRPDHHRGGIVPPSDETIDRNVMVLPPSERNLEMNNPV